METRQRKVIPEKIERCYACDHPTTGEALTCICTECGKRQYDLCRCGAVIARTFQDCPVCGAHRYRVNRKELEARQTRLPRLLLYVVVGLMVGLLLPRLGVALYTHFTAEPASQYSSSSSSHGGVAEPGTIETPALSLDVLLENMGKGFMKLGGFVSRNWLSLIGALAGIGLAVWFALKEPHSSTSATSRRKPVPGNGQSKPVSKSRRKSKSNRR
jgi:hypothetical protein